MAVWKNTTQEAGLSGVVSGLDWQGRDKYSSYETQMTAESYWELSQTTEIIAHTNRN